MTLRDQQTAYRPETPGKIRAIMAVLSRLIAGVILSSMFYQYFSASDVQAAFTKSRLWWEIVMNLQLLSAGMMWFSYSDRVVPEHGYLRALQTLRSILAVCAVSTPAILALLAVINDWFVTRPHPYVFFVIAALATIHLVFSLRVYNKIEAQASDPSQPMTRRQKVFFYAPVIVFALIVVVDLPTGGYMWFVLLPILQFAQGAMPYVMEILGVKTPEHYT